jgi:hypothetical protein
MSFFVDLNYFTVYLLVAVKILCVREQVDFVVVWRIEVSHLYCCVFLMIFCLLITFVQKSSFCLSRQFFDSVHQLLFYFQDGATLQKYTVIEVLHEYLGQDVEVLLVVCERRFDELEDIFYVGQLKLILVKDSDNAQNLSL